MRNIYILPILFFIYSANLKSQESYIYGVDRLSITVENQILHDSILYGYHVFEFIDRNCDDVFIEHDHKLIELDKIDICRSDDPEILQQLLRAININKYLKNDHISLNKYFRNFHHYKFEGNLPIKTEFYRYNEIDLRFFEVTLLDSVLDISRQNVSVELGKDDYISCHLSINNANGNGVKAIVTNGTWHD